MKMKEIVGIIAQRLDDDPDLIEYATDHANELVGETKSDQWYSAYNQAMLNVLVRVAATGFHPDD